jgi:hypothetical protein
MKRGVREGSVEYGRINRDGMGRGREMRGVGGIENGMV